MKKTIFFLLLIVTASIFAQVDSQRLITVTGSSEVRVVPDEVILTLGIETDDIDISVAKQENDRIAREVMIVAKGFGIEERYIQTDYINIEPRYEDYYDYKEFHGYFIMNTIVITIKDIEKLEDIMTAVLEKGVNYIYGVDFRTSELREHRDKARLMAIRAAREKAEALAGELDQNIGKPISIYENQDYWYSGYNSYWNGGMYQNSMAYDGYATETEGPIAPGEINITASVTVSFELID